MRVEMGGGRIGAQGILPPRTAVPPTRAYMLGTMWKVGKTFSKTAPTKSPNEAPTMIQGMNKPPGMARPAAYDMKTR